MTCIADRIDPPNDSARRDGMVGWGAAIIDEQGNEVPITESMIERACEELSRSWQFPRGNGLATA